MSSKPKVSVLIPAYNYAHYLGVVICSILSQTLTDWELIICDDCSTDNTEEVVNKYHDPRIRYFKNPRNLGLWGNFNQCATYAKGEYLFFLCADDYLDKYTLQYLSDALDIYQEAAIAVIYQVQFINEKGDKLGEIIKKRLGPGLVKGKDILFAQCMFAMSVGSPSHVLIRASILDDGPVFNREIEGVADNALWCKISERYDAVYVKDTLLYQRVHDTQASVYHRAILLDIKNASEMFKELFERSKILCDSPFLKHVFIKNRCYPWFDRAIAEVKKREWKRSYLILKYIAVFSKFPWWFPYFSFLKIKNWLKKKAVNLRTR